MSEFYIENKVYYHDTDAGGVVYYASYLEHLEEGRSEYCRHKGIDLVRSAASGIIFPVVHLEVDYKSPARYGDVIRVFTKIDKIGSASVHFSQEIRMGDMVLVSARTVWACVDNRMKPKRIPEDIRGILNDKVT